MKRLLLIMFIAQFFYWGCKDTFNDPNPDVTEIIDSIQPTIVVQSPVADSTYRMLDTLPIKFDYSDDYILDRITVSLIPLNIVTDGLDFSITTEDSAYSIDTFYVVPMGIDTLKLQMINSCKDYAGNTSLKNYQFEIINK